MLFSAINIFLLSLLMSLDDFAVGLAYGIHRKKVPLGSFLLLIAGSTVSMLCSMLLGQVILGVSAELVTKFISAGILVGLGGWDIYLSLKGKEGDAELPDWMNRTGLWESFYLGAALGIDDFAEALGLAVAKFPVFLTVFFFKLSEALMILAGIFLGFRGITHRVGGRLKLIPGIVLILVGIKQLL